MFTESVPQDSRFPFPSHPPTDQFSLLRTSLMHSLAGMADLPLDVSPAFVRHAQLALEIFQGIEAAETDCREEQLEAEVAGPIVEPEPLSLQDISERVASALKVPLDKLFSKDRTLHVAFCRQVGMYLCRKLTSKSFPAIGEHFGRDHSTTIFAYRAVGRRIETDLPFRRTIERIERELGVCAAPVATAAAA